MGNENTTETPYLEAKGEVGDYPASSMETIVDQLDDEIFGIPPNLRTGLLTAFIGTVAGAFSLPIYFMLWEPDHYISPEWLVFVALGTITGFFLRFEQPLYKDLYHYNTKTLRYAQDATAEVGIYSNFGRKADLDR